MYPDERPTSDPSFCCIMATRAGFFAKTEAAATRSRSSNETQHSTNTKDSLTG